MWIILHVTTTKDLAANKGMYVKRRRTNVKSCLETQKYDEINVEAEVMKILHKWVHGAEEREISLKP